MRTSLWVLAAGFVSFFMVAMTAVGAPTLYTSSGYAGLCKITSDGTVSAFVAGNSFLTPEGIAIDNSGNVYLADTGHGMVDKITPEGSVSTFASGGLGDTWGLAFDANGNLYVSSFNLGTISKITPSGSVSTFATLPGNPEGMAFNPNGDLFVALPYQNQAIDEITPSGLVSTFVTGQNGSFLACDNGGNLYDSGGSQIEKITPSGTASQFTGLNSGAVAFDSSTNDLFVTDSSAVYMVSLSGGVSTYATNAANNNFQFGPIAVQPVPEPTAVLLAAAGAITALVRPRRSQK